MRSRLKSFGYALNGLHICFREPNFRIHTGCALIVLLLSVLFQVSRYEWSILIIMITGVISSEAMNSAIESMGNRISRQHDDLIGQAKDIAAAAVLIWSLASLIVGVIIFLPYFNEYLFSPLLNK
jgi:diacylglycerol kinase